MNIQGLQDLRNQVRELVTAFLTLDTCLAEGAAQLRREAEVKRLETMATRICEYLAQAKSSEYEEQRAWETKNSLKGLGKLIITNIDFTDGQHPRFNAFKNSIAAQPTSKQPCFGTIVVGFDKGGLPDDVHVMSISGRAREQHRLESEIIQELQRRGMLLCSPNAFIEMIHIVIGQLREGKLRLPISVTQLPASLAIPRIVAARLATSVQWMSQLPSPKDSIVGDEGNLPNGNI
jgi:hypothetical protein